PRAVAVFQGPPPPPGRLLADALTLSDWENPRPLVPRRRASTLGFEGWLRVRPRARASPGPLNCAFVLTARQSWQNKAAFRRTTRSASDWQWAETRALLRRPTSFGAAISPRQIQTKMLGYRLACPIHAVSGGESQSTKCSP